MRGRKSGEPRARTSALIPATSTRSRLAAAGRPTDWQKEIRGYDLDGPGVCGFYLDLVALLASLCPLTVEVQQSDGTWITSADPVLNTLLSGYTSPLTPQSELVALHVRHREGMGEAWLIDSEHLGWCVVTVPNVNVTDDSVLWTDAFGKRRITPKNRVWKSWAQDPYQPWLPHSPLRRARGDLRRLKAATRNQTRSAESRLVTNGLIAFPDDGGGTRPLATIDGDSQTPGVDQVLDDFLELSKLAHSDDDSAAAAVPFPYIGPKPEYVEVGRGIDQQALEVETKALESFARSVNFPSQLLTNGPGSANHWNEWLLEEAQRKMGLAPKLVPVCNDITEFYLRPMIAQAQGRIGSWEGVPPRRVRVGFDTSFLTSKPDTSAQAIQAWINGIATREEVADMLGIETLLDLPEGMDEYEHWQLATQKPGAPYADVDEDGALVEAPDVFGGADPGIDLSGLDAGGAAPPVAPAPGAPLELPPANGMGAANQAPPAPPPQVAALLAHGAPDQALVDKVVDRLYNADTALEASLSATAEACVDRVTAHVAREVIKAHPPRSEKRAILRSLPVEQVWINADPAVRATFDLRGMIVQEVKECSKSDAFIAASGAAVAALVLLGSDGGIDFDPDLGNAVLAALIAGHILKRLDQGKGSPRFPGGHIRAAMAAAGGAAVGGDGELLRGQDGYPVPTSGGPWRGNTGMTTGHNVVNRLLATLPGFGSEFEWIHAFYRTPEEPFLPHQALDGSRFATPAEVPGGFFPGDHPWCTCTLKFRLIRPGGPQ